MLHSKSIDEVKVNFFLSLLSHKLAGNGIYEDDYLLKIISETHDLACGSKTFYSIDRDNYPIVTTLYSRDKEFFKQIDPSKVSTTDFRKIHQLLTNQPEYA